MDCLTCQINARGRGFIPIPLFIHFGDYLENGNIHDKKNKVASIKSQIIDMVSTTYTRTREYKCNLYFLIDFMFIER